MHHFTLLFVRHRIDTSMSRGQVCQSVHYGAGVTSVYLALSLFLDPEPNGLVLSISVGYLASSNSQYTEGSLNGVYGL